MSDTKIYHAGLEAVTALADNVKAKFAPISHKHTKDDITDLVIDSVLSSTSTNPVQNKVVFNTIEQGKSELSEEIKNKQIYITISESSENGYISDKSFSEIETLYNDGKLLYCKTTYNDIPIILPLVSHLQSYGFIFLSYIEIYQFVVVIGADNSVNFNIVEMVTKDSLPIIDEALDKYSNNAISNKAVSEKFAEVDDVFNEIYDICDEIGEDIQNRKFYINISSINGEYVSDKTIVEIDEAYENGKILYCVLEDEILGNVVLELPGYGYAFSLTFPIEEYCMCVLILVTVDGVEVIENELALKNDVPVVDTELNINSENAISNKAVTTYLITRLTEFLSGYPQVKTTSVSHQLTDGTNRYMLSTWLQNPDMSNQQYSPKTYYTDVIKDDGTSYFDGYEQVTATEKDTWNAKSEFSGEFTALSNKPTTISGYGITDGVTQSELGEHNTSIESHTDIRKLIDDLQEDINNISSGTTIVKEAAHASSATTADSATNATKDGNDNVITETYETKADASKKLAESKSYTDTSISNLINSAPTTLDTLGEIAAAMKTNDDVVKSLDDAIGTKVDKVDGKGLSTNDYTTTEKDKLAGISSGAEVNQNAFSKVVVGSTTIESDEKTDTLTIVAGNNITLTPNASNNEITIEAKDTTYTLGSFGVTATSAELNYVDGVTSSIQTQLDGKSNEGHTHDSSDVDYEDPETGEPHTVQSVLTELRNGKANTNHGTHVPATQTANNATFLRNDNTWQKVTPANIGAAPSDHGTHVSYSATVPVMDGTASVGSASTVARSDHKHPVDTSRASKTEFDGHKEDTTSHITSDERTKWNAAKSHADSSHNYLPSSGGNVSGHVYLTGAKETSSTSNTSQIVFGTSSNNHVALSSNNNALVINPDTSSTTNQIVLYLDKTSQFPSGITSNKGFTGNLTGTASRATADANGNNIVDTYATKAALNDISSDIQNIESNTEFLIKLSYDSSSENMITDKTLTEIKDAIGSEKICTLIYYGKKYDYYSYSSSNVIFRGTEFEGNKIVQLTFTVTGTNTCTITREEKNIIPTGVTSVVYSNLSMAITDINNGTIGTNAMNNNTDSATVRVFEDDNGIITAMLIGNVTETTQMNITADMNLVLNGYTLTLSTPAASLVASGNVNLSINGEVNNSAIVKTFNNSSYSDTPFIIQTNDTATLCMKGGSYSIDGNCTKIIGIGLYSTSETLIDKISLTATQTSASTSSLLRAFNNNYSNLTMLNSTITSTSIYGAVGMYNNAESYVKNTTVIATGTNASVGAACSVQNVSGGILTLDKCTVIGDAPDCTSGIANAIGISNSNILYCNDVYVNGTHSGVSNKKKIYVNGGTYIGYCHGGFYFNHGAEGVAYVNDATIRFGGYEGQFDYSGLTDKRLACFYVGGKNDSTVYLDGCTIGDNDMGAYFVLRNTDGEKNLTVNISNSNMVENSSGAGVIRIDDSTFTLNVGINTNITTHMVLSNNNVNKLFYTSKMYRKKPGDKDCDGNDFNSLITAIDTIPVFDNAGSHNCIYRGKYLGDRVTTKQFFNISNGTFTDMYIGDYWTINGVNYRIAAFDYYLGTGYTNAICDKHHITLVPDTNLYTYAMNDTNITTGAYIGSKMYTNGLSSAKTTINNAFGSSHILSHRTFLSAETSNGYVSGGSYKDSTVEIMSEMNVFGHMVYCNSTHGTNVPVYDSFDATQFPLFRFRPDLIVNGSKYWLRDVASSSSFSCVFQYGGAFNGEASASNGVRPSFSIC